MGPASSADEAGEVQIVEDLLNRADVAAIAISPSNAPLMANLLKKVQPKIPVMTIDADLAEADAGLRKTYLGTDNYLMGVKFAEHLKKLKPEGGTVCLQLGNVAAANINARAAWHARDLSGTKGIERLKGEGGWTEIDACPVFTNDQIDLANQQMADTFTANPDLTAFMLIGGWAQFGAAGLCPSHRPGHGQAQVQVARHRRRWHAAAADGSAESGPEPCPGRPAAVRNGLSRAISDARPDRRQDRRVDHLYRP